MNDIEQCPSCKKNYEVKELGGNMPGSKESEEIRCPYQGCNHMFTRRSNGYFKTYKLPESQQ
ncbi:hypothetical protein VIBRN418_16361 [Vibrio sp. N418]|uniref:hypothetical protein n=1 Tax=Vibrio sp. (strain N418) TaxID=701176 RepID=UPI00021BDFA1|nr:hypothetical protein [Vibrio sp. N418]EGU30877.1 hypothetical protein VIBRN418_16361 [Vibrio sp. N418]EHH2421806.1 hypothetical protein [Vibrio parahaemolyticus]PIS70311.1 hypothetical protein H271_10565 [Vibrio parahaemolyticus 1911C]